MKYVYVSMNRCKEIVRRWVLATNTVDREFVEKTESSVYSLCVSPDNKRLYTGSVSRELKVWDIPTAQCVFLVAGFNSVLCQICITSNGHTLYTVRNNGVQKWTTQSTTAELEPVASTTGTNSRLKRKDRGPEYMALSPNGNTLYALKFGYIYVIHTANMEVAKTFEVGNGGRALSVSRNGKYLFVGQHGYASQWSTTTYRCIANYAYPAGWVYATASSSTHLYVGGNGHHIYEYVLEHEAENNSSSDRTTAVSTREYTQELPGHRHYVFAFAVV